MSRFRVSTMIIVGLLVSLVFSSVSWSEDCLFEDIIFTTDRDAKLTPNSLVPAIFGSRMVITVAHLAPSVDNAAVRGKPVQCKPIRFRIDTITVKAGGGEVDVQVGKALSLDAGHAGQIVHEVDRQSASGLPSEQDLMGFRIRAEPTSRQCSVLASGLFYADANTITPTPVGIIPSVNLPSANRCRNR